MMLLDSFNPIHPNNEEVYCFIHFPIILIFLLKIQLYRKRNHTILTDLKPSKILFNFLFLIFFFVTKYGKIFLPIPNLQLNEKLTLCSYKMLDFPNPFPSIYFLTQPPCFWHHKSPNYAVLLQTS